MSITSEITRIITNITNAYNKIREKGGNVPATQNSANLVTAIDSIQGGAPSQGVKLFSTKAQMDSSSGNTEGDLALVYGEETQSVTGDMKFSSCIFPSTVILPQAFSDNIYGRFRSTGSDFFDGTVELSASRFRFIGYGDTNVRVQYTSSDGITYTRTDGGTELQEFGTTIKWEDYKPWNDVLGSFMKSQGSDFQGLFEYQNTTGDYITLGLKLDDKLASTSVNTNVYGLKSDLQTKTVADSSIGYPIIAKYEYVKEENGYTINTITKAYNAVSFHSNTHGLCIVNKNSKNYIAFYSEESTFDVYKYENGTNSKITLTKNPETGLSLNNITLIEEIDLSEWAIGYTGYYFDKPSSTYTIYYITSSTYAGYDISANTTPTYEHYVYAPSQLDATADYVLDKTFYGKNGVEDGTLTTNVSNLFNDVNAEVVYKIQQVYENMQQVVLTDQDIPLNKGIYFIPTKLDGTSLFDTSNMTNMYCMFNECANLITITDLDTSSVTNMSSMFNGCKKLKNIPLLDTSSVTNMSSMFNNCTSLTTISLLDTSNVTNMSRMFYNCRNLTTIPQLDTSNATNMYYMFYSCSNLTSIPLLDTSSVTNMSCMFMNCTSLTTIPQLNTSKVTDMSYMFMSCTSLTTVPQLNTSSVTNMSMMFYDCTSLQEIDLSGGTINSSASHNGIFYNVPTTCVIYVKDQASKTLLESWDNTHTYTIKTI